MNLFEIDKAILETIDQETGEIINLELLAALQIERNQKIENVACWIKNLQAEADALKAQKETFEARQKSAEKKIESLKQYLTSALAGQKFSTEKVAVSFRSSEAVKIQDEGLIPKKYMVKTVTIKPDKKAIKDMLKAGSKVKGCELVQNLNPQIK
ncbi:siphovirus Gp157 family protein [Treponema sp.]|uniref:siphovirus Gp157 family protein n=1 Tax=Treponema sp. TaxID=166 RepID=UPI00388FE671